MRKRATKPRGRPRAFDTEQALDRALSVFWRRGYEGTSLPALTRAMRINRPSLYAAFGNKKELFFKVLDRYAQGPACYVRQSLAASTARGVFERLLGGSIALFTSSRNPAGCLAVHGALACGEDAEPVRRELIARRAQTEALIRRRLERARAEGDLPAGASPADLARYATTVIHGLSIQAAGGAKRAQLLRIADIALRAWPRQSKRPPVAPPRGDGAIRLTTAYRRGGRGRS